ncbi:MAG TPA: MBL fold metallo-hydrolase [Bryobacteraceae bacterium]|nr:MBL fold metallo-hydrolase [Bryobacteraceae bacterium]
MKLNRISSAAIFAILLLAGFIATKSNGQPNTLKQIVPGVWFREGDIANEGHCNNIIIEMSDYLIIVDANFPSGARKAMADAKRLSSKPIKYVFDTHHHGDHAYGNPVWTQAGATTLAYVGVIQELKRYEPAGWQNSAKSREDVAELKLATAEPPKQTFDKSPFVLKDSKRRVEFHHFGWAHTRGDGFVYLPKEKVLCTGDALVNGPYNYVGQANIKNWNNVLRAAQKLKADYILPGHGGPGGKELFEGQMSFFTELVDKVQAAVKQGKKLEDLVTMEKGKKPSTTIELPESVKNWTGDGLATQVKDTYEEITQGKPHGEIVGGK